MRIADELVTIAISSHDDHFEANIDGLVSNCGDDVVSLETRKFTNRDAHGGQKFFDDPHLLAQDVRARFTLGLIRRFSNMTESWLGTVKSDNDAAWTVILQQRQQH